jgi:hypothetical protein
MVGERVQLNYDISAAGDPNTIEIPRGSVGTVTAWHDQLFEVTFSVGMESQMVRFKPNEFVVATNPLDWKKRLT